MRGASVLAVAALLVLPPAASAQLSFPTQLVPSTGSIGRDLAFDPANNVVLSVEQKGPVNWVWRFLDPSGVPLTPDSPIGPFAVRVAYSSALNSGAGGFLMVWTGGVDVNSVSVFAQVVAYPTGLIGPRRTVAIVPASPFFEFDAELGLAYSPISQQFLLAWSWCCKVPGTTIVRLDLTGQALGAPLALGTAAPARIFTEHVAGAAADIAWNSVRSEFGVVFQDLGAESRIAMILVRVRTDGTIAGRHTLAEVARDQYWLALDVSTGGNYMVAWGPSAPPFFVNPIVATVVAADGSVIAQTVVPARQVDQVGMLDVVFSPLSNTFLLAAAGLWELNTSGILLSPRSLGFFFSPQIVLLGNGDWLVTGNAGTRTVRSATRDGGCTTGDPFAALGGGTCVNFGWLPPGIQPPPAPVLNNCTTSDPFVALGGGTCRNGGWLPPGIASPAPTPTPTPTPVPTPPPPAPGGCGGGDPFVALGGGTCVNGGWLPPGIAPNPTPPPPVGCLTPDPFAAIPGMAGICLNGGWLPTRLVQLQGTLRFAAATGVWALETSGVLQQLSADPPARIRFDGLAVSVLVKIRIDRTPLPGYAAVIEVVSVFGP